MFRSRPVRARAATLAIVASGVLLGLAGCWNGENTHVSLGSVSIGQQLIDLQRARDEGAIDADEYQRIREMLTSLGTICEITQTDDEEN